VTVRYPERFFEPFTRLSWLAGITTRVRLGTTVLVVPYRHPLLVACMAGNLEELSGGRLVLGVGAGGARHEFEALGVPFAKRGRLTDEYLATLQQAWGAQSSIPLWVGRNSAAAIHQVRRRLAPAARHPAFLARCGDQPYAARAAPRIALRLTSSPVGDAGRLAGTVSLEQILDDLGEVRRLAPTPSCSTLTTAIRRRPAGPTWPGSRSPPWPAWHRARNVQF
jgi:alkanesulfonate monooxygenase SsuD/methylene tetrahydromethanopterin reductase-like flavin-dependent oxidoreductase (luciferase family)